MKKVIRSQVQPTRQSLCVAHIFVLFYKFIFGTILTRQYSFVIIYISQHNSLANFV